jgi:hypothetical protein
MRSASTRASATRPNLTIERPAGFRVPVGRGARRRDLAAQQFSAARRAPATRLVDMPRRLLRPALTPPNGRQRPVRAVRLINQGIKTHASVKPTREVPHGLVVVTKSLTMHPLARPRCTKSSAMTTSLGRIS